MNGIILSILCSALLLTWAGAQEKAPILTGAEAPRYRVAVCDWMILKRQKLGAFALAREIRADGVEVDMGGLGQRDTFDNQLNTPETCEVFLTKAKELGLEISSIAMSGFYAQSFSKRAATFVRNSAFLARTGFARSAPPMKMGSGWSTIRKSTFPKISEPSTKWDGRVGW